MSNEDAPKATRAERWVDKPVARITAIVGLIMAIVTAIGVWPDSLWPRAVPVVDASVQSGAHRALSYTTAHDANAISDAPAPNAIHGCLSEDRVNWVRREMAGIPSESMMIIDLTARRDDTTVLVTDFRPVVHKKLEDHNTVIAPCGLRPEGGAAYFERTIGVTFSPYGPKVTFRENDEARERLGVALTKGDAASFVVQPFVEGEQGVAYEWYAEMDVLADGKKKELRLPREGFFYISAEPELNSAVYWSDRESPTLCRPADATDQWCTRRL